MVIYLSLQACRDVRSYMNRRLVSEMRSVI